MTAARAKRIDRFMGIFISAGGLTIIAAVAAILFFIGKEALPLFFPATTRTLRTLPVPSPPALLLDESGAAALSAHPERGLSALRLSDGAELARLEGPALPWRLLLAPDPEGGMAVVDAQGRLAFAHLKWEKAPGEKDPARWTPQVQWSPAFPQGSAPRRLLSLRSLESGGLDGGLTHRILAETDQGLAWAEAAEGAETIHWNPLPLGAASAGLLSGDGRQAFAGTAEGELLRFDLETSALLERIPFGEPLTALGHVLGRNTVLAGGAGGKLAAYQMVRKEETEALRPFHAFDPLSGPVRGFRHGLRDKRFLAFGEGGAAVAHLTTERSLYRVAFPGLSAAALSARGDFILLSGSRGLRLDELDAPHPEVSWRSLWAPVHYEGYAEPELIWQSSGGSDQFEPKFSLRPLVFGTLKGTLYALLFAVPIAVLGALYTSQFATSTLRSRVKPTLEIMAALPSVVLGFVAGLVLAPLFERLAVAVILAPLGILAAALLALPLWRILPASWRRVWGEGREALWMIPLILAGLLLAWALAPGFEKAFLGGDYRAWLPGALGLSFDQRNSVVVGFAMGFAVIPIIFTLSEDALSGVPRSLASASLACGASPWQTAWRVILPTASPGIFSAVMVGLGRAIGETMIVLMATGNTPVMDWNPFNGMRTLSANIAVEIPEAPHHGTLYRILFLAALLLFLLTFLFNTAAELIRHRLRRKYESW